MYYINLLADYLITLRNAIKIKMQIKIKNPTDNQ